MFLSKKSYLPVIKVYPLIFFSFFCYLFLFFLNPCLISPKLVILLFFSLFFFSLSFEFTFPLLITPFIFIVPLNYVLFVMMEIADPRRILH